MGNYKSVNKNVDATKLQRIYPEPEYQVKTHAPIHSGHAWRQNILLRIRQQQLSDEAMPLARRKCLDYVKDFQQCRFREGFFWYVFNCQENFYYLEECLEHEFNVEMDKRRRNMNRNPQSWWQELYNEHGEVGRQAKQSYLEDLSYWDTMKSIFTGKDQSK